ncbi:hypothetical protein [Nocardioides sp.]|uniref:hypothetical protein n=1 Tax=Nocardioides sp. TaxID=35761 RepID=UPI002BD59909|nr:hypothetical protein [Nocardioides sp.]HSX67799.1 hypothetical protein [Nocardioides sp.]
MRLLVAGALVGCLSLNACSSERDQWCGHVEEAAPKIGKALDEGGSENGLLDALPVLHDLADEAPDDVRGEWRTLVRAIQDLDEAVEAEDEKATQQAALKLASPDVQDAAHAVDQEARDVCHTPLF